MRVSAEAAEYVTERRARHEFNERTAKVVGSVLAGFAKAVGDPDASELSRAHVDRWIRSADVLPSSLRHRLSTVRGFCQWLVLRDVLVRDPTLGMKGPRKARTMPRVLAHDDVAKLLETAPDARARLIITLMVQEGLRAIEVSNLEWGDIDEVNRMVRVVGKFGNQRLLPLTNEALRALRRYLAEHPPIPGPLIRSYDRPRRGIGPHYISCLLSGWMLDAGVKQRPRDGVSGHALRRTAATDVAGRSKDPHAVAEMLGHNDLSSLGPYIARLHAEELRPAMEGRTYRDPPPTARGSPSEEDDPS